VESGDGRVGTPVEELLLYCFQYDPTTGRYGLVVMNLVRLGGLLTLAGVLTFVLVMRWRDVRAPAERHT
jgi:protein SCO1/2